MQKSWSIFIVAVLMEMVSVIVLMHCIISWFEISDSVTTPGAMMENLNWFSKSLINFAVESETTSGNAQPAAVIRTAHSVIYFLGGLSILMSIGALIMIIFNVQNPRRESDSES